MSEEIMKVKEWVDDTNKNDLENFNAFLIHVAKFERVGIRRKMLVIRRYMDAIGKKNNDKSN